MQSIKQLNHKILEFTHSDVNLNDENLFCSNSWVQSIQSTFGSKLYGIFTYDSEDNIVAIFTFYILKKRLFTIYGAPIPGSFIPYQDPIIFSPEYKPQKNNIVVLQIRKILEQFNCSYFEFRSASNDLINHLAKQIIGKVEFPSTYIIDLMDEELNWKMMKDKTRNMVKKAIKNDVKPIVTVPSDKNIDIFYDLLTQTFKRSGKKPLHSKKFIKTLINNLYNDDKLLFLSIQKENQIHSMGLFAHDKNTIHFISGASNISSFKYGSNNLMQWEVIKYAISKKIKKYDMGGRGINSIDKFKEGFGGKIHYYGKFTKKTLSMRTMEVAYKFLRSYY
tara:strand:+ start:1841 stop:2842 length:1002 start_codon:yes stop_codon:yes gene_type:complete